MNSVVLLTKLQLMQTLGGVRSAIEKRAGANGAMAGTALIGIALFIGVAWLGYSAYSVVGALGLNKVVFDMLFLVCGVLTFALSLPAILSTFFGASDINDLLPLPVSPFAIAFSKALSALATSYLYTFLIIAAPLAGWGVAAGAGAGYWLAYALAVLLAPMMPVAYAGTISIIIAALFKRVRTKDAITTIATVLTLGISIATFFVSRNLDLGGNAAAALEGVSDAMGSVVMAFPAYGFAVYALVHSDVLSCALFDTLSATLTETRWQRDLTDSTTQRNIGSAFGYAQLALYNLDGGLDGIHPNEQAMQAELDSNWEVLGEAIQTAMRAAAIEGRDGMDNPYERVKELMRGKRIGKKDVEDFVATLNFDEETGKRLAQLTPSTYWGVADKLVDYDA